MSRIQAFKVPNLTDQKCKEGSPYYQILLPLHIAEESEPTLLKDRVNSIRGRVLFTHSFSQAYVTYFLENKFMATMATKFFLLNPHP